jgi:hypothetical protein
MSKTSDNEAFVRRVQARLGVTVDGWAGGETNRAWDNYSTHSAVGTGGNSGAGNAVDEVGSVTPANPGGASASGGATSFPAGFPRREPGVNPLTTAQADELFGRYAYVAAPTSDNREAIRITDGWDSRNIVTVVIPQLVTAGVHATGRATMHRLVVPQTQALWQAWEDAGLLHHVDSWEGMFVARFIRGSRTTLSNHAKGTAFDINAARNGLGQTPAAVGKPGSVRELVPLAVAFGFYWGGWFSRNDGMHFEVRRLMPAAEVAALAAKVKELARFDG